MRKYSGLIVVAAAAFIGGLFVATTALSLQGQTPPASEFAAVPGERGGWDLTGPYEVVPDWPKPLSQIAGHEQWTWGATEGVFAESANRVFALQLGELPRLQRPAVWAFEDPTAKVVKYDREGHLLYAWGGLGDYPGGFLNMHGATVDPDGNLYIAEVGNGRVQKFRPRGGANPALLIGKPLQGR